MIEGLKRVFSKNKSDHKTEDNFKYTAELNFWKKEIENYVEWYEGKLETHYMMSPPREDRKVIAASVEHSAILTWLKLHQEPKYLEDLKLEKMVFSGLRILDIGSGPLPGALVFEGCEVYCLDPLLPEYIIAGYPLHYYERVKFVYGFSENIPVEDNFFDAAISVNVIDHVDDIYKTALEIKRVLKPEGKIRIHAHYHKKTVTEPLELNDEVMTKSFSWCEGLKKVKQSTQKRGSTAPVGEVYALWTNFE